MAKSKKKRPSAEYIQRADKAIKEYSRTVKYFVTDYSLEFIVGKLIESRYYVPDYQREHIWTLPKQSKFIESVLMGLPIPFVFFWQDSDGRMEIVDGSQRLRTIRDFMEGLFELKGLETIVEANGLTFQDFPKALQYKFSEVSIRAIILDHTTDAETRTEMFARINTGGTNANEAEIRRGSLPGPLMDLITELSKHKTFVELTPISAALIKSREREELVTRFFAYVGKFDINGHDGLGDLIGYKESPKRFYFNFVKEMNDAISSEIEEYGESRRLTDMRQEFIKMLEFVQKISPNGFTKSETGHQVPRVRFEAIAVGTALALRENEKLFDIAPDITPILDSDEFGVATKSDAANVKSKLIGRITLLKDWLLL